jgi:hypothetical protein
MSAGSRRHQLSAEHATLPIAESRIAVAAKTASGARWNAEVGNGVIEAGEAMTMLPHNNASADQSGYSTGRVKARLLHGVHYIEPMLVAPSASHSLRSVAKKSPP